MTERTTDIQRKAGMTLIEVVIAMAVLGIALTGIMVATGRCLAVAQRARAYEIARALIDRVEQENPLLLLEEMEEGKEHGRFEGGPEGFTWERRIERMETEQRQLEEQGLFRVTTRVIWIDHSQESAEEVVTLFFRLDQERDR